MRRQDRRREEIKRFCKNARFRMHKLTRKLCIQVSCSCVTESGLGVYSFTGKIEPATCSGRCVGIPFTDSTFYTTTPLELVLFSDAIGPAEGAAIYYDEALTMPITSLSPGEFLRITDCVFLEVVAPNNVQYVIC